LRQRIDSLKLHVLQLGLNSPFKSGVDYWRDSSRAELGSGAPEQPPLLPPVGDLFSFKAASAATARATESGEGTCTEALPPMPGWLLARPYLTGEFLLQVAPQWASYTFS
jgi:hypothetical protein